MIHMYKYMKFKNRRFSLNVMHTLNLFQRLMLDTKKIYQLIKMCAITPRRSFFISGTFAMFPCQAQMPHNSQKEEVVLIFHNFRIMHSF